MKLGIDVIRFTLYQFLVGAASSRDHTLMAIKRLFRGWKPLPQAKSRKLPLLNLF